jgi:hypothetical protein
LVLHHLFDLMGLVEGRALTVQERIVFLAWGFVTAGVAARQNDDDQA